MALGFSCVTLLCFGGLEQQVCKGSFDDDGDKEIGCTVALFPPRENGVPRDGWCRMKGVNNL